MNGKSVGPTSPLTACVDMTTIVLFRNKVGLPPDFNVFGNSIRSPITNLLSKLNNVGVCGTELQWFTDYLSIRKKCVGASRYLHDKRPIDFGVLQGPILRHL